MQGACGRGNVDRPRSANFGSPKIICCRHVETRANQGDLRGKRDLANYGSCSEACASRLTAYETGSWLLFWLASIGRCSSLTRENGLLKALGYTVVHVECLVWERRSGSGERKSIRVYSYLTRVIAFGHQLVRRASRFMVLRASQRSLPEPLQLAVRLLNRPLKT